MTDNSSAKKHQMKLRNQKLNDLKNKKLVEKSSSDSETSFEEDESSGSESEMNIKEYRTLLSQIFPSKYISDKAKNTPIQNKQKTKSTPSKIKSTPNKIKNKKEDESEDIEETEETEEEDELYSKKHRRGKQFNIILTMDNLKCTDESEEEDSDYEYEDDEEETDETVNSSDEDKLKDKSDNNKKLTDEEIINEFKEIAKKLQKSGNKNSKVLKELINSTKEKEKEFKLRQKKENKKKSFKNCKQFNKLLQNKNVLNDKSFFREKLSYEEQCKILKEMETIQKITRIEKPYRIALLESNIPPLFKSCAIRKLNQLRYMEPGTGEYYKIKNWIDTFMQIPFGVRQDLPITIEDGVEKCHEFMDNAKRCLDESVFGLNDAKLQIMQMVGQWISNPDAVGTAIAIHGPMGTGKTTLVKDGISKILNREFAFIALGGATDSSFLEGHSYTYEGSTWGKIIDILIQCKSMNPIIYFDELDKVSDTPKGEEIIGILTHLTDSSQNSKFHDKYFSEVDFDLSKCLFIFSYNDEKKVNPILRDRMYRINTSGYDKENKTIIANDYLMPTIIKQVKFKETDIIIPTETIQYIIEHYTNDECGVRNLKRCIEIIYTKLNLYRLMKPNTNLFEKEMSLKIEFPLTVTEDIVQKLIKKEVKDSTPYGMYT